MKKEKLLALVIFSLVVLPSAMAFEMTISAPRNSYIPYETFQAEIKTDFAPSTRIALTNIFLENHLGEKVPISPSLTRIADTHYFIFFTTPYVSIGDYSLVVKDVTYLDRKDNHLKQATSRINFFINSTNRGFDYILSKQAPEKYFVSVKDAKATSMASLAIKKTYPASANQSAIYLEENIKAPENCFPVGECRVVDTVLSMLALKEFGLETNPNPWLNGAFNKQKQGEWFLSITSHNTTCIINGHKREITEDTAEIPMTTLTTTLDCTTTPVIKITHRYMDFSYTMYSSSIFSNLTYTIDDSRCWGKEYKSPCDYESTAYAAWMLQNLGQTIEPETIEWMKNNLGEEKTLNHALNYLVTKDIYSREWLMATLKDKGYWGATSQSEKPDLYATTMAAYAMKDDAPNLYAKVRSFMADKTSGDVFTSSSSLYFLFSDQVIPSVVRMDPGLVFQKSNFELLLENHGEKNELKIDAPNLTKLPPYLLLDGTQSFKISVPENQTSFNIRISYDGKEYVLPVITAYKIPVIKQPESKESELNTTIEPSPPTPVLLPPPKDALMFITKSPEININISKHNKKISLRFKNQWEYPLHNITFKMDGLLYKILSLDQAMAGDIEPDEIKEQTMSIKIPLDGSKFQGTITASSIEGTLTTLPVTLHYDEEKSDTEEKKIILEESPSGRLPDVKSSSGNAIPPIKPEKNKTVMLVFTILGLVLVILILYFMFRKKIVKIESFDDYMDQFKKQ